MDCLGSNYRAQYSDFWVIVPGEQIAWENGVNK